ncbi:Hypothetical protein CINCED_3A008075 [Cinara cedri]|uniref:Uncharacterized protein n=1 Tax=Cinara cedri TaxID=506608 RepID=A0A5E4NHN6_9HEMI|nr:Hypothetical protein CINCED_3A008075 [Cinara cedri]
MTKSPLQSVGCSNKSVSRRRPVLNKSASQTLLETRIASFNSTSIEVKRINYKWRDYSFKKKQEQKLKVEEEKLKPEEMRTKLLKIQIERETGVQWIFTGNDETK